MNDFVIADPDKCIGCRTCEIACVLAHCDEGGLSGLTPEKFTSRLHVVETANITVPVQCRQCENAPCVQACPKNALQQGRHCVEIYENECIGCKACMLACPYGAIEIKKAEAGDAVQVIKCDLCKGQEKGPACIDVCPTKALREIKERAITDKISERRKYAAGFMRAYERGDRYGKEN